MYTAFARDVGRGVTREWVRNVYRFAPIPDGVFYFKVPVETSLLRITATRPPKYYEAGMDLNLSDDPYESYTIFQSRVINEYDDMVDECGFYVVDGKQEIKTQQKYFREKIEKIIEEKIGTL
jgi:dTMP kinase